MSWLSQALKRNHLDVLNQIAKPIQSVVNPIVNDIPGVQTIRDLGQNVPGAPKPVEDAPSGSPATDFLTKALGLAKGATGSDWLKAIGGAGSAALNYAQQQAALNQRKNEFNRTTGDTEAQVASNAQQLLNRAPMADQAQYLLRARMGAAPTTFAPRDYTRTGMSQATMSAPAMGGPQTQLAAGQQAAASYTPNAGGVDTSVLEMLKKRMLGNSGMAG